MKRLFDIAIIVSSAFVVLPITIVLMITVRIKLGTPIFFTQIRPGILGKPFRLIKFRTMKDERDAEGKLIPDVKRLTEFGRFLRSTSLDELPELWNVLKGDMSIVGPRPLLMEYLPKYSIIQARRHEVLPGITGWAQVNGRNTLTWDEKFKLDVWYVDNRSLLLDMRIILMTVKKVVYREGISPDDCEITPRFDKE